VAPRYGGPSRAVFEMCRATRSRDVETLVATTDADGPNHIDIEKGTPLDFQGTQTIFFPRHLSERFGYSYRLGRWLKANVKNFDVVHIHAVFSHPCLAAARACRQSSVPYIVRPLGSLDPWSMNQKHRRKRLLWHAGIKRMLVHAAAIHYTTGEEKRLAEETLGLGNGTVIPLGIELEAFRNRDGASIFRQSHAAIGDNPYVLVLSRLHPKKNLDSLIEAFAALSVRPDLARWRLVIAGDGEANYVARLKQQARGSGGDERFVFTGWLSGVEKASALQGAALLALPSYQENFGLCVAEALACGVPAVVSRRVNLAAEIEETRAGWVTGQEPAEIENTLAEAMSDGAERERRGQAGREFVARRLAWPQVAGDLVALYYSVAEKSAAPIVRPSTVELVEQ
jgi:glycosyltransferase involved in cell wall biosynthesis